MFHDASVGNSINIVLVRIVIMEENDVSIYADKLKGQGHGILNQNNDHQFFISVHRFR